MPIPPRLASLAKDLLPPVVVRALRPRGGRGIHFSDPYPSWAEAKGASTGYDVPSILEKVTNAALKVKRGEAAYERDSVLFDRIEYSWPVLAGLMWAAARDRGVLGVLDFGGSLGTSYFQNRKFLEGLSVRWSIVEQPHFVRVGRESFEDEELRFHATLADAVAEAPPAVVLLGGSLQFIEEPYGLLESLARIPHRLLIVDRTPFSELDEDRVCVQHVEPVIYPASYPSHILSRPKFERWMASHGWRLLAPFEALEGSWRTPGGFRFAFGGMLLTR